MASDMASASRTADTAEKGSANSAHTPIHQHDHGAETELRRVLSTRHVTMIALGSSIGTFSVFFGSAFSSLA